MKKKTMIMKTMQIALISFLCANPTFAQNTFPSSGDAGIGTTTPNASLHIISPCSGLWNSAGPIGAPSDDTTSLRIINNRVDYSGTGFTTPAPTNDIVSVWGQYETFVMGPSGFAPNSSYLKGPYFAVGPTGKVGIGLDPAVDNVPGDYQLYVYGGILTEKLKIALHTDAVNWSDFVFDKNYKLMSLNRLDAYLKENKHLPEIPSTKEVAKDGIDVAAMDAKLLQKIEELTLYVIGQQKDIEKQQASIAQLQKENKELHKAISSKQ